ncbi:hypothetical protein MPH_09374, partial [Macrophomina phaseolina MS6]
FALRGTGRCAESFGLLLQSASNMLQAQSSFRQSICAYRRASKIVMDCR